MDKHLKLVLPLLVVLSPIIIPGNYPDMTTLSLSLFTGAGYVYYLNFENDNKNFLIPLSIIFFLLPISYGLEVLELIELNLFFTLTSIFSVFAAITYTLRYAKKANNRSRTDVIKLVSVLQLCAVFLFKPDLLILSNLALAIVYFSIQYGISIKNMNMIKNVILGFSLLISIFLIVLANIKASEAEKQQIWAQQQYEDSKEKEEVLNMTISKQSLLLDSLSEQLSKCRSQ